MGGGDARGGEVTWEEAMAPWNWAGRHALGVQKQTVGRRVNKSRVCYDTNGRPCIFKSKGNIKCYKRVE